MSDALDLFARHLDLAPLRGRRRGVVRCRFHEDTRASLSVDLDRGLFHCFGCSVGGGMRRSAELVGEQREPQPRRSPARPQPPLETARRAVLATARHQPWARPGVIEQYRRADLFRMIACVIDGARRIATQRGPEDPQAWELLENAAALERVAALKGADVA